MMKTLIKAIEYCLLASFLVYLLNVVVICQSEPQDGYLAKIDEIELYPNGSATWFVEKRYFLGPDESAIFSFLDYWSLQRIERERESFSNLTMWFVNYAKEKSGRDMEVKDFKVSVDFEYSQTDYYGLVKYQYKWLDFAIIEGRYLLMGDALWWSRIFQSNQSFAVKYPSGYRFVAASPPYDEHNKSSRVLKWQGPKILMQNEPMMIFENEQRYDPEQFTREDRVDLHTNGSVTWFVERKYSLTNISAVLFSQYWSAKKETELQKFIQQTMQSVDFAENNTGRSMEARNFKIEVSVGYNQTGFHGFVKYQYDWLGFAKIEDKGIVIGDALWNTSLRLDDTLIVRYPSGYRVIAVSPLYDDQKESERTLTWYGPRTFGDNEFEVIFEEKTFTIMDALKENLPLLIGGISLVSMSFVGLWFYRFRRKEEMKPMTVGPLSPLEMKSEEEVIALLKSSGGSSYQSTITKRCGFSKAKTSMLLASMESKGMVRRKKQGRERIVTLLGKS